MGKLEVSLVSFLESFSKIMKSKMKIVYFFVEIKRESHIVGIFNVNIISQFLKNHLFVLLT